MSDVHFEYVPDFKYTEDGSVDKTDAMRYFDSLGMRNREKFVELERAKILQEELSECYRVHGVNHHEMCAELAAKYHSMITDPKFGFEGLRYNALHKD